LIALLVFPLCLSGCAGPQNPLSPAGAQAGHISDLWWFYFWTLLAVYTLVLLFLLWAVFRVARRPFLPRGASSVIAPEAAGDRRLMRWVAGSVTVTVVLLFVLFLGDLFTGKSIHSLRAADPLTIRITGHQWWWEINYEAQIPSNIVITANEIHIPVGRPIQFKLESHDVIHSFWVPNLDGKKDLIPGHPTTVWLNATQPGIYRGQCAEFCGHQHANMRFLVIAEPEPDFKKWLSHQRENASIPDTQSEIDGQKVFMRGSCVMCHAIQGTLAGGTVGPNLTHVSSRRMLAAGRIPNTRGYLAGWILDPQHLKPGNKMPQHSLPPSDLFALLDYLQSLK
jgi:cytochrome c oxidase subunit 2